MTAGDEPHERPEPSIDVARIAFENARRALEHQASSLDELRSRTSTLLAVIGIGTAFLAGAALTDRAEPFTPWTWIGFVAPIVSVVLVGLILIPVHGWTFFHKPDWLLEKYYWGNDYEPPWPARIDQAYVWMTEDQEGWRKANKKRLGQLYRYYRYALFTAVITVAAWISDLVVSQSASGG